MPSHDARRRRQHLVADTASAQHGVISRRQLLALGLTRWDILAELRAGRWRAHGKQTIAIHSGALSDKALLWHAVIEAGSRAVLDGTGSLLAAGLTGFHIDSIRLSVPRGAKILQARGATVRQTRRLRTSDIAPGGIPRVKTPIAAVRAALWAVSDRQAALILAMVVQQRLATAEHIARALLDVRRDKRRRHLEAVVVDLVGGSESMGELDFATKCHRHGIPAPDRQVVRRLSGNTYVLDARWARYRVVVEIDGIHHLHTTSIVGDALRQNAITLTGDVVLRLPLLGLRAAEGEFFAQIRTALTDAGWPQPTAA